VLHPQCAHARTAGYGRALVAEVKDLDASWREVPPGDDEDSDEGGRLGLDEDGTFTLTLLSAAIVRDDSGQHTPTPLPALACFLRRRGLAAELECRKIFQDGEVGGGFNRKWGLPLPQVLAAAAGSVFVCRARREEGDSGRWRDAFAELEAHGLGERRAEGFGRVAINWHTQEATLRQIKKKNKDEADAAGTGRVELNETERRLADLFLKRLLRRDLDAALRAAVEKIDIKEAIPNSQLSRWRAIIRSASAEGGVERLKQFYGDEEAKKSRGWQGMHRARVTTLPGNPRLTDWMRKVLLAGDDFWNELSKTGVPEQRLGVRLIFRADQALRVEYQLRLLDGVLAKKAKEQANKGRGREGAGDA
jgi:CRISPR-associated protein Csx10